MSTLLSTQTLPMAELRFGGGVECRAVGDAGITSVVYTTVDGETTGVVSGWVVVATTGVV